MRWSLWSALPLRSTPYRSMDVCMWQFIWGVIHCLVKRIDLSKLLLAASDKGAWFSHETKCFSGDHVSSIFICNAAWFIRMSPKAFCWCVPSLCSGFKELPVDPTWRLLRQCSICKIWNTVHSHACKAVSAVEKNFVPTLTAVAVTKPSSVQFSMF